MTCSSRLGWLMPQSQNVTSFSRSGACSMMNTCFIVTSAAIARLVMVDELTRTLLPEPSHRPSTSVLSIGQLPCTASRARSEISTWSSESSSSCGKRSALAKGKVKPRILRSESQRGLRQVLFLSRAVAVVATGRRDLIEAPEPGGRQTRGDGTSGCNPSPCRRCAR